VYNVFQPNQNRFREIYEGDVLLLEETWSEKRDIVIRKRLKDPSTSQEIGKTGVRVIKRFHVATLHPHHARKLTVITFEPEEREDKEMIRRVSALSSC